LPAFRLD
jgi:hypothetical protein